MKVTKKAWIEKTDWQVYWFKRSVPMHVPASDIIPCTITYDDGKKPKRKARGRT